MLARVSRAFLRPALPALTARAFSASAPHPSHRLLCLAAATVVATTGLYVANSSPATAAASSSPSVLSFGLGLSGQNSHFSRQSPFAELPNRPTREWRYAFFSCPGFRHTSVSSPVLSFFLGPSCLFSHRCRRQYIRCNRYIRCVSRKAQLSKRQPKTGRVFTWGHGGNDGKLGLGDAHRGYAERCGRVSALGFAAFVM
jgi:hypothetical protein